MLDAEQPKPRAGSVPARRAGATARSVFIVDDHRTFADLLAVALGAEPHLRCVGVAYDVSASLATIASLRPDVVCMDMRFQGQELDGIAAIKILKQRHPDLHVVLLTGHPDVSLMRRAVQVGASALMPKDGSLHELLAALNSCGKGGLWVHPHLLQGLLHSDQSANEAATPLSPRESDVLALLALGSSVTTIAGELGISVNTCRGYVKTLLWKLDAHSQAEAVSIAWRQGLVPTADRP